MLGKTVSHYKITEQIGCGGMGIVYKAEDVKLHRIVALKFLPPQLTCIEEAKNKFIHEAQTASALQHNNICTIHDIDETEEGQIFICMDLYDGETLKKKIERHPLAMDESIDIAIQIASGLEKAHLKGIIHNDIKPANIFITDDGVAKILDFGLAKLTMSHDSPKEDSISGTVAYMSPEQAQGLQVDHRTDIWSLGVILYEMLTGYTPFKGEYEQALIYSISNEQPSNASSFRSEVPPQFENLISKMMEKEKSKRFQDLEEVISELKEIQTGIYLNKQKKIKKLFIPALTIIIICVLLVLIYNNVIRQSEIGIIRSVAVLPFIDLSPNKDQGFFCNGITVDLINRLSNVKELKVPARTSIFTFKDKQLDVKEIGKKLGVRTILEGSIQKAGERLRITVQLIDTDDGYYLWSEKYDRQIKDVFTIQDEISSSIVNVFKVKLTEKESQRLAEHPVNNVKAYEYSLKADQCVLRYDKESLDSAVIYLKTAIDILGDNAYLYSALADVYAQYSNIGRGQEEYIKLAQDNAVKALNIQSDLASALSTLGFTSIYDKYPEGLQNAFRYQVKAITTNPNEIKALHRICNLYSLIGKPWMAEAVIKRAQELDSLNPHIYLMRGPYYWYDCRFREALEQHRMLYQYDSNSPIALTTFAALLVYNGKFDDAVRVINKMENPDLQNVIVLFSLALKYGIMRDKTNTVKLITLDAWKTCRRDFEWSYHVATAYSLAGLKPEALDWLDNAVKRGFINYKLIKCDPLLENIRNEKRFTQILSNAKNEYEHFQLPE